jgi:hypothetical protein
MSMNITSYSLAKALFLLSPLTLMLLLVQTLLVSSQVQPAAVRLIQLLLTFWVLVSGAALYFMVKKQKRGWFLSWFFVGLNMLGTLRLPFRLVTVVMILYFLGMSVVLWKSYKEVFSLK